MTIDIPSIIATLTDEEEEVLHICAKHRMSQNKNFQEKTIQKKLPRPFKDADVKSIIKKLATKGLVRKYRNRNWCMTDDGLNVAHFILEERRSRLEFTILKHGMIF